VGTCHFLNVLLGLTVPASLARGCKLHLAAVVGLYIVGVTWFARTEARMSRKAALEAAAAVMVAALLLALPVPVWFPPDTSSPLFPYLLVGLGFLVDLPVGNAIARPAPAQVQTAVKRSIMGLVLSWTPPWRPPWRERAGSSSSCYWCLRCIWGNGFIPPDPGVVATAR
jgi:4-hydroxybenzoate polyprenyltransferase